jgi:hypothetical protein
VHCLSHRTCCTVIIEHALTGVLEAPLSKERAAHRLVGPAKLQSFQVSKSQVFIAIDWWRSFAKLGVAVHLLCSCATQCNTCSSDSCLHGHAVRRRTVSSIHVATCKLTESSSMCQRECIHIDVQLSLQRQCTPIQ